MKFSRFLGIFLSLAFTLICFLLAESGGAPVQAIGNPGLCFQSGCHTSFPLRTDSSLLTVTGFPSTYTPGTSYPVTVTVRNNPTASASSARAGFAAFVNRDGTAFTSSVGTIAITDAAGTRLLTYDGGGTIRIAYVTHSQPRAGSPSAGFTFQWTAPATPSGNAVLVVGANSANGDGQNTGDVISKQTVTAAAGAACTYAIAPTAQSFPAAGGTSSINITTDGGCAWTAASNSSFITVTAGPSGSGAGTVNYAVAANMGAGRTGTLTVAGQTFTVTQVAGDCAYSITPTSQAFAAAGGTATVSVTTTAGCAWTATSGNPFIAVASGSSGTGSGTVILSVAANAGSALRTGTATIAGETFSVSQAGAQAENEKSNFAQFGNGDLGGGQQFTSTLIVINRSATQNASGTARIFDNRGNPMSVRINGVAVNGIFPVDVPPLGIRFYASDGVGVLSVGSVQLSTSIPVSSVIIFSSPAGTTGVGAVQPLARFLVPIESDSAAGIDTGVAASNSTESLIDVIFTLRDTLGRAVAGGSAVKSIPPNGQLAQFAREIFASQGIDFSRFRGTIEVNSPVPINGMAIRVSPGQFSTLPVAQVN